MDLERKTIRGMLALLLRQGAVQFIGIAGGIILTRLLEPGEFGLYAICTFLFYLLVAVGDLGLGAALVRRSEVPTLAECRTTFFVRQCIDAFLLVVMWFSSPFLAEAYGLPVGDANVFRLVSLSACIFSLQSVPTILLERQLKFRTLAAIETVQTLVYMTVLTTLAYRGTGAIAFGYGWLSFALSGALLALIAERWRIGWAWNGDFLREALGFSVPYQAVGLLSLLKDGVTPIFVGMFLGTAAVGYLNWATMLALSVVTGLAVLQRVYLSAFSRLLEGGDEKALQTTLLKLILLANSLAAPISVIILTLSTPITELVFGVKWTVALPLFYVLWCINLVLPTVGVFIGLLNSLGHSKLVLRFTLYMSIGMWILAVPFILWWGTAGYCIAAVIVNLFGFTLVREGRRRVHVPLTSSIVPPWCAAALSGGLVMWYVHMSPVYTLLELATLSLLELLGFSLLMLIFRNSWKNTRAAAA